MTRQQQLKIMLQNDSERYFNNLQQDLKVWKLSHVKGADVGLNEVFQSVSDELNRRHRIRTGQEDIIGIKIKHT